MTIRELLKDAPEGQWLMLRNCPAIHHMMTGIKRAGIRSDGTIRVQYSDENEQEFKSSNSFLAIHKDQLTLLSFASEASSNRPNESGLDIDAEYC